MTRAVYPPLVPGEIKKSFVQEAKFAIYAIIRIETGKRYVGHTCQLQKRIYKHWFNLNRGMHQSPHLQRAWSKYGEAAFEFRQIGAADDLEKAVELEQTEIDAGPAYNLCPAAKSTKGLKRAPETIARIAATLTGRKRDPSIGLRHSAAMKGRTYSLERRGRMRAAGRERNGTQKYKAFGRFQFLNEWADEFSINQSTLESRVTQRGIPLELALTMPMGGTKAHVAMHEAFGKKQTLKDWAAEYGMSHKTLTKRIAKNPLSLEQALTRPLGAGRGNFLPKPRGPRAISN